MLIKRPITYENVHDAIETYIKESQNIVAETTASWREINDKQWSWDGSLYSITDRLIADVGKYCDHYQSDLLLTINAIMDELKKKDIDQQIFIFGIRKNGVDGVSYTASRVAENPDILDHDYYRKIYAVYIEKCTDEILQCPMIRLQLKDISDFYIIEI